MAGIREEHLYFQITNNIKLVITGRTPDMTDNTSTPPEVLTNSPASIEELNKLLTELPLEFLQTLPAVFADVKQQLDIVCRNEYLTKKELGYRLNPEQKKYHELFWLLLTVSRSMSSSLLTIGNLKLTYVPTPDVSDELHCFDQSLSKLLSVDEKWLKEGQEFIVEAMSDEAIYSSKLEGAVTTEALAKEMIRKQLTPKRKDEMMILNNHEAMQFILNTKEQKLSPEFICGIQRIVTKGTLANEDDSGRFRTSDDIYVVNQVTGDVLHYPPKAAEIPLMIQSLCDFVNADGKQNSDTKTFIHPLIVGIVLHFLIGYIHPFADGNGRTARSLFYWYVISRGYTVFQYLPLSKMIKRSPSKYRDAYLHSEEDFLDLTYFIRYNISCIQKARKELTEYISRKIERETKQAETKEMFSDLSERQYRILLYMADKAKESFSINEIAGWFNVVYQTARTDLMQLEARKYLRVSRTGKKQLYSIDSNLAGKLRG
mgnify:FL=1